MMISELLSFTVHFSRCPHAIITVFGLATKTTAILRPLSVCKVRIITVTKSDFFNVISKFPDIVLMVFRISLNLANVSRY